MTSQLTPQDALVIVDAQIDFFPGGALAVPEGDTILPALQAWLDAAIKQDIPIIASRDWHPPNHCSFTTQGGPWPMHCVQETRGAQLHPDISLPARAIIVYKGDNPEVDNYSAFEGQTEAGQSLENVLREKGIHRLFICGLAQDYCVRDTALDGRQLGFEVHLILNATKAITPDTGEDALNKMRAAGVLIEEE